MKIGVENPLLMMMKDTRTDIIKERRPGIGIWSQRWSFPRATTRKCRRTVCRIREAF